MRQDQLALQLYTVRRPAAEDLPATLERVAAAGYRRVELAGLPEIEPGALRAHLDGAGLEVVAAHRPVEELRADPSRVLDSMEILRCPRLIAPALPEADRTSPDSVRRVARELGQFAQLADDRSIRVGYHNHDFEFAALDGTTIWDVLLESLPESVEVELDVYWADAAGQDPVDLIDRLAGRVRLLHMKDVAPGPVRRDAPPGEGTLPWDRIVDAGRRAGVEWYIVEQDEPRDPIADIASGLHYLRQLASPGGNDG